jgi:hypothetical protein
VCLSPTALWLMQSDDANGGDGEASCAPSREATPGPASPATAEPHLCAGHAATAEQQGGDVPTATAPSPPPRDSPGQRQIGAAESEQPGPNGAAVLATNLQATSVTSSQARNAPPHMASFPHWSLPAGAAAGTETSGTQGQSAQHHQAPSIDESVDARTAGAAKAAVPATAAWCASAEAHAHVQTATGAQVASSANLPHPHPAAQAFAAADTAPAAPARAHAGHEPTLGVQHLHPPGVPADALAASGPVMLDLPGATGAAPNSWAGVDSFLQDMPAIPPPQANTPPSLQKELARIAGTGMLGGGSPMVVPPPPATATSPSFSLDWNPEVSLEDDELYRLYAFHSQP